MITVHDSKMNTSEMIEIDEETLQDIINIETGLFFPLRGFMNQMDFKTVVEKSTLANGKVFTIPITLSIPPNMRIMAGDSVGLAFRGRRVASIKVEDIFETHDSDWEQVFRTADIAHPGVRKEKEKSSLRIGGETTLLDKSLLNDALKPSETKAIFAERGWKTIVGFQTRNPIHKAHEYIQRLGLEICDGLFINPIVGWKKNGDFSQAAVMAAYEVMIDRFYPKNRVYLAGLKTQMRYAGPREAIFHAIIRRNLGCTHFIIGRDHAGVGGYYGEYDAHKFAMQIEKEHDIGIQLLLTREPYFCNRCGQIVTDRTCNHYLTDRVPISGTEIRKYISNRTMPDETMMRREVLEAILNCGDIFVDNEEGCHQRGNEF